MAKLPRKYTRYGILASVAALASAAAVWDSVRVIRMIRNRQSNGRQPATPGIFNLAALPPEIYAYFEAWLIRILHHDQLHSWPFILYCRCNKLLRALTSSEGRDFVLSFLEEHGMHSSILDAPYEDRQGFEGTTHPAISRIRQELAAHATFRAIADKHTDKKGDLDACWQTRQNLWRNLLGYPSYDTSETIYWENMLDVFLDEHGLSRISVIGLARLPPDATRNVKNLVALGVTKHLPLEDGLFARRRLIVQFHLTSTAIPKHIAHIHRHLYRFHIVPSRASWFVSHQPSFDKQLMNTAWALCSRTCPQDASVA